jgi:hypothetical protein
MSMSGLGNLSAGPGTLGEGIVPAAAGLSSAACVYSTATRSFLCPPISSGGLVFLRSFTIYDAGGNPQSVLDGNTASIRTLTATTGTLLPPNGITGGITGPIALDRHDDMTMSRLNVGQPTLNGTSVSTMSTTITPVSGPAQRLAMVWVDKTTDLLLPPIGAGFPRSGSIEMTATTTTTLIEAGFTPVSTSFREVMTFDGSNTVTITLYVGTRRTTCKQTLGSFAPPVCSSF